MNEFKNKTLIVQLRQQSSIVLAGKADEKSSLEILKRTWCCTSFSIDKLGLFFLGHGAIKIATFHSLEIESSRFLIQNVIIICMLLRIQWQRYIILIG